MLPPRDLLYQRHAQLPAAHYLATVAATISLRPTARASTHRILFAFVRITGIALEWIGSTIALGSVVRKP